MGKQTCFQPVAFRASVIENFKSRRGRVQLMNVPIDRADVRTELMVLILRADVRTLGGVIRSSFRDTVVEPSGEGCLCVVFASVDNFEIGRRPTIMGELEQYVKNTYGKDIYFKARLMGTGERMDTVYVSDEELRERIHMDIAIEEE